MRLALATAAVWTAMVGAAAAVTLDATGSDNIEIGGPSGSNDFYAQGNDDTFAEYGIASFTFDLSDFGGTLSGIDAVELELTVNDRTFANGSTVELFLTTQGFGGDFSALSYNDTLVNGIDGSQFIFAPVSLGTFTSNAGNGATGGVKDQFMLPLGTVGAPLMSEIAAGSEFHILIGAVNAGDSITYAGVGNVFETDPNPSLTITPSSAAVVPLPGGVVLLGAGLLAYGAVRRRR